MNKITETSILKNANTKLKEIIRKNNLYDVTVSVLVKTLTPEEAIGEPGRRDFPIVLGKERVIEANVLGARAHAFTDSPGEFVGRLREIVDSPLTSNKERAVYIATLNAVLKYLNLAEKTIHCRDEDPENCAKEMASHVLKKWGKVNVGLVGLNPAIAENLINTFDRKNVAVTDLDKQNYDTKKYGVEIWNGNEMTEKLIKKSDVVIVTGTTLVNGTFENILHHIENYRKDYLMYGVTGAGICELMGLNRICPYGRDE